MELDATEQGVQHESHHVSIDTTPQVCHYRDDSESRHPTPDDDSCNMVYASFSTFKI